MTLRAAEEVADPDISPGRFRALWRRAAHLTATRLPVWLRADFSRLGLWAPVAIGLGAGFYFGLKTEPHWSIGAGLLVAAVLVAIFHPPWRKAAIPFLLVALGFVAAEWRTAEVAAPVLTRDLDIRAVRGRLISVEERVGDRRLVIALDAVDGISPAHLPAKARITWRGAGFDAAPGDEIALRAGLGPPPPPAAPGAVDFARQLYFEKIGAVGFAVRAPEKLAGGERTHAQRFSAMVERMRETVLHRIVAAAPNQGGAVVAAIVTGKRDAISDHTKAVLRDAGLAHLLAISGLHMGLATGLVFFALRGGLALIEPVALRFPIKKWAAAAALISGLFYLVLSGGGWSARRAFITAAIMFIAILADRRALSLRNVAIAASIILLTTPEALFQPGFQMSFAAVTALVAFYEWVSARTALDHRLTWEGRLKRYAFGLVATDVIAAGANAPFALYHFNRVALYSLPANVLAMPLMAFWIIPAAVLALLLAPIGLDAWAWRLAAGGVETILAIAAEVSSWPGAVAFTPHWPLAVLLALAFGGLWLCLARSPLRLAGLAAIPIAALIVAQIRSPDVFVAASGQNAGLFIPERQDIALYSGRRDRFSAVVWREYLGLNPSTPRPLLMKDAGQCDDSGCVMRLKGDIVVSVLTDPASLAEDCARADLIVALFSARAADWRACAATLIDGESIQRRGAHAVWIGEAGAMHIKTVNEIRGRRPWTVSGRSRER